MIPIHIQIQNINEKLVAIESKLDTLLAQPALPPEVNLEGLTSMLGQILAKTDQIFTAVAPQTPVDLTTQAQQAMDTLQQIQEQLSQQVQQANNVIQNTVVEPLPEPLEPEPLPDPIIPEE